MRTKMFEKGEQIKSMDELSSELRKGNYVFLNHKPQHPGWVGSMMFRTLEAYVRGGGARFALRTKGEE